MTALLQSSTATGLMTASFAADGVVGLVPALAIMVGPKSRRRILVRVRDELPGSQAGLTNEPIAYRAAAEVERAQQSGQVLETAAPEE